MLIVYVILILVIAGTGTYFLYQAPYKIKIPIIVGLFLIFGCCFYVLTRVSEATKGIGTIIEKTSTGPGSHNQLTNGNRTVVKVNIKPRYHYGVTIENGPENARFTTPIEAGDKYKIGSTIKVTYITKGIEGIWSKVLITEYELIEY